ANAPAPGPVTLSGVAYSVTYSGSAGGGDFILTIGQPPAITSANSTTFQEGTFGSFTVTATGAPTPTLSEAGTLPAGVMFNANTGVLSGTPAAGTAKTYNLMFTASNGALPNATQNFTLTVLFVNHAPTFTKGPDQTVPEDA